jgi:hypothetical protein
MRLESNVTFIIQLEVLQTLSLHDMMHTMHSEHTRPTIQVRCTVILEYYIVLKVLSFTLTVLASPGHCTEYSEYFFTGTCSPLSQPSQVSLRRLDSID